jgi:threonine synthase
VGAGKLPMGWFDLSTLKEPYRIEGKKTMGLELVEQLDWHVPDVIFYPTGGGTGLIGMWKVFAELEAIGLIGPERPRMVAVQASGCAPIVRAFEAGERHATKWEDASTVAAGIRVPAAIGFSDPRRRPRVGRLCNRCRGSRDYGCARPHRA